MICYGPVAQQVLASTRTIRLLICDVDSVMSNGLIYISNHGDELKAFNVRDGYGIRCLITSGIEVAIITGRTARLLEDRCATLGITHLYQGQSDKTLAFRALLSKLKLTAEQVAYVSDDLIDAPMHGPGRPERGSGGRAPAIAAQGRLRYPHRRRLRCGKSATCCCWRRGKPEDAKGQSV